MKDKIFALCDELNATGIKPTLEKVRDALGGGSFSSINPILKEWKEEQIRGGSRVAIELPAEALEAINQATQLIWKIATDKNAELANSMKNEFETLLKEAVTEKEEALKEIARLEQTAAKLNSDNESQTQQISALSLQLQKLQLLLDADVQHIEELKTELKQVHNEANTLSAQVQKQELLLSAADSQNAKLSDLLEQKKTELDKANNAAAIKEQEFNAALKEANAAKDKALQETKEARKEADKQTKELNALNLQVQKHQISLDAISQQNESLNAEMKVLKIELKEANSEAAMLKGQLVVYEKMQVKK
jgi:chromosome segregation ATPase